MGIPAILGELDRAGLLHADAGTGTSKTLRDGLKHGTLRQSKDEACRNFSLRTGGIVTTTAFSQSMLYPDGIRIAPMAASATGAHAYSKDGGLRLHGNIALDGCM